MKKKMFIIDGHSLAHRAFHALKQRDFRTSGGLPTGAIYGVVMMVLRLIEDEQPDYLVVAEDVGKTFRHEAYADYKGTRKPMDDDLRLQLPYIKEFYEQLGVPVVGMDGYEADDVIGSMARQAQEQGFQVCVVTGDKDSFQLVADGVCIYYTLRGITDLVKVDSAYLQEKYGLTPAQWRDFKALRGDPADNIPGIPGIGEKTASRLLQKFNSLAEILERVEEISSPKVRNLIKTHREEAKRWADLVTIKCDLKLPVAPGDCRLAESYAERLVPFFEKMEFKSLLRKILPAAAETRVEVGEELQPEVRMIDAEELPACLEGNTEAPVALQLLATTANWEKGQVIGLSFSKSPTEHWFLPLAPDGESLPAPLTRWLADAQAPKVCHDGKTQMMLADHYQARLDGLNFDTMLGTYLVSGGQGPASLERAAAVVGGLEIPELVDEKGKKKSIYSLPAEWSSDTLATVGGQRTAALIKIFPLLAERIKVEGVADLFYQVEMPLLSILFAMEKTGVKVCPEHLHTLKEKYTQKLAQLETEIYALAGEEFNISSPKQLGMILFERLGLPVQKRTKTGYSTDAEVLEALADRHPLVQKVLDYRGLMKLNSTYVEALLNLAHPPDYRIHTTFNQAVTATGRLSSAEPNLQNIPIRTEEGREIRRCFIPENRERVFLSADYSQIELRIMAHLAGDKKLIAAFHAEEDIHRRTAAEIFNLSPEQVGEELRERAKAVNFGIIYGISGFGLAKGTGVTRKEAEEFINAYFRKYEGVKSYLDDLINQAREDGYVTTIMNRRRYLPDLTARSFQRRSFAERMARNTPIQGSAADLIKLAMVRVYERLQREKIPAVLLIQVHDELLVEVEREALPEAAQILREEMERAYELKVPLRVDVKSGENWGDLT
ncbi:MAG: DNA polymerase I [Firmicutes bacterium]|nr:DNA polymerase I [Bacillota bacterium]